MKHHLGKFDNQKNHLQKTATKFISEGTIR